MHNFMGGYGMGYSAGWMMLAWYVIILWFVVFSALVLAKLDKLINILEKKD